MIGVIGKGMHFLLFSHIGVGQNRKKRIKPKVERKEKRAIQKNTDLFRALPTQARQSGMIGVIGKGNGDFFAAHNT